jgi:hypothetical protein
MLSTQLTDSPSHSPTISSYSYSHCIVSCTSVYLSLLTSGASSYVSSPLLHILFKCKADEFVTKKQIHDSDMITGHPLEAIINGPAHHTLHHLYFTVNYGQVTTPSLQIMPGILTDENLKYFTWADRVGKSYRKPESSLDPLLEVPPEPAKTEKKEQ